MSILQIPLILLSFVILTACAPAQDADADKLRVIATLIEVHNTLETDRLDGVMHSGFKRTAPDVSTETLTEYKNFLRDFHSLFENFDMQITDSAVSGDSGFIQWNVTGTYIGAGAKDGGSSIDLTGLGYYQFKDGMMISEFIGVNPGWFREQL